MHKNATKCNKTLSKWCKNKHGASKIIEMLETYQGPRMIPCEWIISHRCSWMAVYVFCRNAHSKPHSDPRDVYTLTLLYQLPNYNLFTQHALFILWRDTTSELWTPVQFPLHSFTVLLLLALFTFLHTIILLPLDMLIPLFTANR
jgi:hypothetical protein